VIHTARARGLHAIIGRFHNVYGPRMGVDHVIPELSPRALRREDPFRVYGADQRRAFCRVSDAVEAMRLLIGAQMAWGQIVNIGNDTEETRVEDLARLVLKLAHIAPVLERLLAPAGSVARRCPDLGRSIGNTKAIISHGPPAHSAERAGSRAWNGALEGATARVGVKSARWPPN